MSLNRDLASRVLRRVLAHPEQHDQHDWLCGTTACLARHTWLEMHQMGSPAECEYDVETGEFNFFGVLNELGVPDTDTLWEEVFGVMDPARAIQAFAAYFGLDPASGDLLPEVVVR